MISLSLNIGVFNSFGFGGISIPITDRFLRDQGIPPGDTLWDTRQRNVWNTPMSEYWETPMDGSVFSVFFDENIIPEGLLTSVSGVSATPTISIDGLLPVDGQANEMLVAIDLSEGEILIQIIKNTVINDTVQITAESVSYLENTADVVDIKMVFGAPPSWWLTSHNKTSGNYMQIITGSENVIQDWPGMTLEAIEFFDKAGFGETTYVKSVKIYKTAKGWV